MSRIRVNNLRDLQEDLRWPLLADEFFSDVGVIDFRTAELETEVERALSVVTEKNSKCGAGVVVMPVTATDQFRDASARHPLRVTITYLVLEVPVINMGAAGTKKSALSICERIRQVMKHYELGGLASPLVPADPTFQAVDDPIAPVAWEVRFECYAGTDQMIDKPARVNVEVDDITGTATLSCSTPDVSIYFTLDGSYPFTSDLNPNPAAVLYGGGPIALEGEWTLRTAAFKAGHIPGDVTLERATQVSAQDGSGTGILGL